MRIDPKQAQEILKRGESQTEEKPESRASRIMRSVVSVILVVGIIAFMVYLFPNR